MRTAQLLLLVVLLLLESGGEVAFTSGVNAGSSNQLCYLYGCQAASQHNNVALLYDFILQPVTLLDHSPSVFP